jgi:hypothetical protein
VDLLVKMNNLKPSRKNIKNLKEWLLLHPYVLSKWELDRKTNGGIQKFWGTRWQIIHLTERTLFRITYEKS